MFRIVKELSPTWVLGENVAGFRTMGLDQAIADLESAGYSCRAFNVPAVAVNADHERKRIFIVAHAVCKRWRGRGDEIPGWGEFEIQAQGSGIVENAEHNGLASTEESGSTNKGGRGSQERKSGTEQPQRSSCSSGGIKVVAYTDSARDRALRYRAIREREKVDKGQTGLAQFELGGQCSTMADPRRPGLEGSEQFKTYGNDVREREMESHIPTTKCGIMPHWRKGWSESGFCREFTGFSGELDRSPICTIKIPNRKERLKCLGNAVVPAQVYPFVKAIYDIEMMNYE